MPAEPVQNTECDLLSFPIEVLRHAEGGQVVALRQESSSRRRNVITHLRDGVDDDHPFPGLQQPAHGRCGGLQRFRRPSGRRLANCDWSQSSGVTVAVQRSARDEDGASELRSAIQQRS